jgi:hypothetical protein
MIEVLFDFSPNSFDVSYILVAEERKANMVNPFFTEIHYNDFIIKWVIVDLGSTLDIIATHTTYLLPLRPFKVLNNLRLDLLDLLQSLRFPGLRQWTPIFGYFQET